MNTYQSAELLYKELKNRYTYEYLIKVMEANPDEFVRMMKQVYNNRDPEKATKVEQIANRIVNTIEEIEIEMPHLEMYDVVQCILSDEKHLADDLKDLSPIEIVKIIELITDDYESEGYHFYLFHQALKELEHKHRYPQMEQLIGLIRNIKHSYINHQDISNMIDDL